MTDFPILVGEVHMREDPSVGVDAVEVAIGQLLDELRNVPSKISVVGPAGRRSSGPKYSSSALAETLRSPSTGTIVLERPFHPAPRLRGLRIFCDLRFAIHGDIPTHHSVMVPLPENHDERRARAAAIERFLIAAARPADLRHGAIYVAPSSSAAMDEISLSGATQFGPDGQLILDRLGYDSNHWRDFLTKARRTYWTTILGPTLAAEAGGVDAARATGAARVEVSHDCLVVQATEDPADYLTADWAVRARPVRRWLWPHTIRNPFDDPS